MPFTRRDFGKLAIPAATGLAFPGLARAFAPQSSKIDGVQIGAITYSFRQGVDKKTLPSVLQRSASAKPNSCPATPKPSRACPRRRPRLWWRRPPPACWRSRQRPQRLPGHQPIRSRRCHESRSDTPGRPRRPSTRPPHPRAGSRPEKNRRLENGRQRIHLEGRAQAVQRRRCRRSDPLLQHERQHQGRRDRLRLPDGPRHGRPRHLLQHHRRRRKARRALRRQVQDHVGRSRPRQHLRRRGVRQARNLQRDHVVQQIHRRQSRYRPLHRRRLRCALVHPADSRPHHQHPPQGQDEAGQVLQLREPCPGVPARRRSRKFSCS